MSCANRCCCCCCWPAGSTWCWATRARQPCSGPRCCWWWRWRFSRSSVPSAPFRPCVNWERRRRGCCARASLGASQRRTWWWATSCCWRKAIGFPPMPGSSSRTTCTWTSRCSPASRCPSPAWSPRATKGASTQARWWCAGAHAPRSMRWVNAPGLAAWARPCTPSTLVARPCRRRCVAWSPVSPWPRWR